MHPSSPLAQKLAVLLAHTVNEARAGKPVTLLEQAIGEWEARHGEVFQLRVDGRPFGVPPALCASAPPATQPTAAPETASAPLATLPAAAQVTALVPVPLQAPAPPLDTLLRGAALQAAVADLAIRNGVVYNIVLQGLVLFMGDFKALSSFLRARPVEKTALVDTHRTREDDDAFCSAARSDQLAAFCSDDVQALSTSLRRKVF